MPLQETTAMSNEVNVPGRKCTNVREKQLKPKGKNIHPSYRSYKNEDGEMIWICAVCGVEDYGTIKMIGCDVCDEWFHWDCVNLVEEPDEELWYCPECDQTSKRKTKRKKKSS